MGRTPVLILVIALVAFLAGCGEEGNTTKADAQKEIFAPTDVDSLSPEMKAKVEAIQKGNATSGQPAGN